MLVTMRKKTEKPRKISRPPRIRVPNNERVLFTANTRNFVGVVQRLSLTGGSVILSKGPVPEGTLAEMALNTVFGKVTAHIQFLQTGAEGILFAQAFRFLDMDDGRGASEWWLGAEGLTRSSIRHLMRRLGRREKS
jgi:hypothetical protein